LWEQVWQRDSWLEILGRYMVSEKDKKQQITKLIFPRNHQLDATRKLQQAVLDEGAGQKYRIQYSAGSGKTNSIAWSAHFLADLHYPNEPQRASGGPGSEKPAARALPLTRDDNEVERSIAMKGLMNWVRLHPYNISQKVQIVVEHFRETVAPLLEGRAKAMVVVSSRLEAVRWQLAINFRFCW